MREGKHVLELTDDEMEYVQGALHFYLAQMADMAQADNRTPVETVDGRKLVIDLSDMFSAQFVEARNLLRKTIEVAGRDLTEESLID